MLLNVFVQPNQKKNIANIGTSTLPKHSSVFNQTRVDCTNSGCYRAEISENTKVPREKGGELWRLSGNQLSMVKACIVSIWALSIILYALFAKIHMFWRYNFWRFDSTEKSFDYSSIGKKTRHQFLNISILWPRGAISKLIKCDQVQKKTVRRKSWNFQ